jgi:hypothetical protein
MLVSKWNRSGVTVQFGSTLPINVENPHELVTRLDSMLVQAGIVPKLERFNREDS